LATAIPEFAKKLKARAAEAREEALACAPEANGRQYGRHFDSTLNEQVAAPFK